MTIKSGRARNVAVGALLIALAIGIPIAIPVDSEQTVAAAGDGPACEASGQTLQQARQAYAQNCQQPRIDCDPIQGAWVCSSEQIGRWAPRRATTSTTPTTVQPSTIVVNPSSTTTPGQSTTTLGAPSTVGPTTTGGPDTSVSPSTTRRSTTTVAPTTQRPTTTARPPTTATPTTATPTTVTPTTATPTTATPTTATPTTMHGGHKHGPKPYLPNGLPTGSTGTSELQIENKRPDTRSIPPNIATFRMDCHFSHMNFDDAIVHPGMPGKAHLHVYFGNTTVDANSDPMRLSESGNSTCAGGRANRSAYWVPAIIDTNNGNRVLEPEGSIIYYKAGWAGAKPNKVVAPPNGLRVIAGNQNNSQFTNQPSYQRNINWACTQKGQIKNDRLSESIPTDCRPGELLVVRISFPQCWDGKNLDSADHQSHMAYLTGSPQRRQDCPASHPVLIPRMSINAYFKLTSTDTSGLRLASDGYDTSKPGGLSAHADWIVGWDQQILERVLDGCFRPADDCGHNNFNDGQGLRYPRR